MSSSDFTQRRRQERQVQAAAHAEEVQHGTHGHGKEERAETADQNAGSASGGDGHTWTSTWGKNRDKIIRLNPKITDGRGSWRKCDGTDRCWGKWSPSGTLRRSGLERANESPRNPAVAEEVARPVSLPPEEPPGLEVVRGNGSGGLLSGLTPGVK